MTLTGKVYPNLFNQIQSINPFKKSLLAFIFFCIVFHSPFNTIAMDQEDGEHQSLKKSSHPQYTGFVNSIDDDQDGKEDDIQIAPEEEEEFQVGNENHVAFTLASTIEPRRDALNDCLEELRKNNNQLSKVPADRGNDILYTSLLIFNLPKHSINSPNSEEDDSKYSNSLPKEPSSLSFLKEFDERFFKPQTSKGKWAFRIIVLPLELYLGLLAPGAVNALNWYLSESLVWFIEPAGPLSKVITYSSDLILLPTCLMQLYQLTEHVGDWFFRHQGLIQNDDKSSDELDESLQPHIHRLGWNIERGENAAYCQSIHLPTAPFYLGLSITDAAICALPFILQFADAESTYFNTYYKLAVLPLGAFFVIKTATEDLNYLRQREYKRKSTEDSLVHNKVRVLESRLKTLSRAVNSPKSKELVIRLYELMQSGLKNSDLNTNEYISALSLLFVKSARIGFMMESMDGDHSRQQLSNLTTEIHKLPPVTPMRNFIQSFAVYTKGLAALGELTVYAWGIEQLALACGLDPTEAATISFIGAAIRTTFSAFPQSNIQEQAFLGWRSLFSRQMDFWPLRWATNTASAFSASFLSIAFPGIIAQIYANEGTSAFPRIFVGCVAASTIIPQWTTFYELLKTNFDTLVTKIVTTLPIKTTEQKKAWINLHLQRMMDLLPKLTNDTIDTLYDLTQEEHDQDQL
ncbi:MAG: hypothetical protein K2W92_07265 [Alphaproteobacteria bacterium]|nr:hypothetical protein [Alphaproteobacteria bacterium]